MRIDVLKRFGFYSTESNGHLSEYLPWYRKRPDEIMNWIDLSEWIHGETGGYLRYSTENRNWFEQDFPKFLDEAGKPLAEHERTDEHASHILEALETGRTYRGHFNVRNGGTITNLPADCIIESPGFVDRFGINMVEGVTLPLACAATCSASVSVQRMAVRGGDHRRRHAAEAGGAARPAGRRDLHPRGGLADGRRAAGRPGAVAAAVRRCDPRRRGPPPLADRAQRANGRAPPASGSAASRNCARASAPRPARRSAPSSWAEANAFTSRRQPDRACKPLLACPHISSRTSVSRPVIAAAAAIAGLSRWVRPPRPCRPSKLRFEVEAQRSPGASWSGFIPRHIEQPAIRQSKPASISFWRDALLLGLGAHEARARHDHRPDARP